MSNEGNAVRRYLEKIREKDSWTDTFGDLKVFDSGPSFRDIHHEDIGRAETLQKVAEDVIWPTIRNTLLRYEKDLEEYENKIVKNSFRLKNKIPPSPKGKNIDFNFPEEIWWGYVGEFNVYRDLLFKLEWAYRLDFRVPQEEIKRFSLISLQELLQKSSGNLTGHLEDLIVCKKSL